MNNGNPYYYRTNLCSYNQCRSEFGNKFSSEDVDSCFET